MTLFHVLQPSVTTIP